MYNTIHNYPWERNTVTYPYIWWDNAFTNEELDTIISYCESQPLDKATIIGTDSENRAATEKVRRCDIKFINYSQDIEKTRWMFDRFNGIIKSANDMYYGFDLNGYEMFQYTSYNSSEEGTYDWHMDTCMGREYLSNDMFQPRKLSLTLLLNDPSEFDGGDFLINQGNERDAAKVELTRGRAVLFPSFMIHKVAPVTRGFRKSAVIWVLGPKFR